MGGARDDELAPTTPALDDTQSSASDAAVTAIGRARTPGACIGRYELRTRIGAGAMGEVWIAFDPQLDREVAIKLVHPRLARSADVAARMLREARAMAKLSHRGVVSIHDAGEVDGELFLAMELVRGRTLGQLLRARTPDDRADWRRWLAAVIDAGRGLAAAHAAGVLHRDFKPDNVLVEDGGRVCVGDFGLATVGEPRRASRPALAGQAEIALTMTGALLGTPAYMSLEQLHGAAIDARADQFSFCVVAYEALYGERPFDVPDRANLAELDDALSAGAIRPPPAGSQVPSELRALLLRGLATSPADRWPDLAALLAALEAARDVAGPIRRHRRWIAVAAAAAAVVAGAGIALRSHHVTSRAPAAAPAAAPRPELARAVSLGPIPVRALVAVSPGGRIAIGTDHLEVRDLATGHTWWTSLAVPTSWVRALELEGEDTVRFSLREYPGVMRWSFTRSSGAVAEPGPPDGVWRASLVDGELISRPDGRGGSVFALERGGRVLHAWPVETSWDDQLAVAPSRRRFAYGSGDRFGGRIVVQDAEGGPPWRSPPITGLTAFTWLDDHTLAFATTDAPTIEAISVDGSAPAPRVIYHLSDGFAARLFATDASLVYIDAVSRSRVHVIERSATGTRALDPSVAASELGWTADGEYLTWNSATRAVERIRAGGGPPSPTHVTLEAEPMNATLAGDLAIVAERGEGGRVLVARDLATGVTAWRDPPGRSFAARCARDLAPPCYVARRTGDPEEHYEIEPLDPHTGAALGAAIYHGPLEDFAVSPDGRRVLVADGGHVVSELDARGAPLAKLETDLSVVRSVAYDPAGGELVAGTGTVGSYIVERLDGGAPAQLSVSGGELLSLVRPSPVSGEILTLGRTLTSELFQVPRRRP